jgi:O-methyltransferase
MRASTVGTHAIRPAHRELLDRLENTGERDQFDEVGRMSLQGVVRGLMPRRLGGLTRLATESLTYPVDFSDQDVALHKRVAAFTMTSAERVAALADACRYISRRKIEGDFVECGVWRGGSSMAAALTLLDAEDVRELFLFDTYTGMTPPSAKDRAHSGEPAESVLERSERNRCIADEADVAANLASTGYPGERVHLIKGDVLETIPVSAPPTIALLRLDTDFYESTRHELAHLYPRLSSGGVLIIDDYGHWQGARQAVDEYFSTLPNAPLLARIDYTGRLAVKP